ncbi:hypothetical protein BaRGS_00026881 [Batillaria attramentaria]|uniref:Uncharacterized protein n=1 Tax=Batillaria attramentaria TaxID=370345 RepID=A0ABD0K4M5_9CAEN
MYTVGHLLKILGGGLTLHAKLQHLMQDSDTTRSTAFVDLTGIAGTSVFFVNHHHTTPSSDRLQRLRRVFINLSQRLHQQDTADTKSAVGSLLATGAANSDSLDSPPSEDYAKQHDDEGSATTDEDISMQEKRQQGWHVPYGKRQQAWHTTYGKRHSADDVSPIEAKRQQGWETAYGKRAEEKRHILDDVIPAGVKRQQGWHTTYGKRQGGSDVTPTESKRQQGWETAYGKRAGDITSQETSQQGWHVTYGKRRMNDIMPITDKRQQGWETAYGKRGDDVILDTTYSKRNVRDFTLSGEKRQQGWETAYGKRANDVIPFSVKRQQGWETTYGKRADDVTRFNVKRQQGWETAYGKRADDVIPFSVKRQQGWHVPYGKREDNDNESNSLKIQLLPFDNSMDSNSDDITFLQDRRQMFETFLALLLKYGSVDDDEGRLLHTADLENDNELENEAIAASQKRQQGWHTPYGKRATKI